MTRTAGSDGAETRSAILRVAADIASTDGLEGLSIGQLAKNLGMSKSGLFAHFGSKVELQLATIGEARQRYVGEVIRPGLGVGEGIVRLDALSEKFISYLDRAVFTGGCFFASAMAEFDGKPDGPVRALVVECQDEWMATLNEAAQVALDRRELRAATDPYQLAFDVEAALLCANWYRHLFDDRSYLDRARQAVHNALDAAATPTGRRRLAAR